MPSLISEKLKGIGSPSRDPRLYGCLVAAVTGALGVLSGYAIFFLYRENAGKTAASFWIPFGVAAVVAALVEWLRDLVSHGAEDHSDQPWIVRALGTLAVVGLFELFVEGFHASTGMGSAAFGVAIQGLLGASAQRDGIVWDLAAIAGIWVFVGAALAVFLSLSIPTKAEPSAAAEARTNPARSIQYGALVGFVVAPLALLIYVLLIKIISAVPYMAANYQKWANLVGWIGQLKFVPTTGFFAWLLAPAEIMNQMSGDVWKFLAVAVGFTLLMLLLVTREDGGSFLGVLVVIGWILAILIPLVTALGFTLLELLNWQHLAQLGQFLLLAALIWGVPGILLGWLTPWLRVPASGSQWAILGYASAFLLVVARFVVGGNQSWPFVLAGVAILSGTLFQRGFSVVDYWPFAALSVAIGIGGAMSLLQSATFVGEVRNVHALNGIALQPFTGLQSFEPPKSAAQLGFDENLKQLASGLRIQREKAVSLKTTESGRIADLIDQQLALLPPAKEPISQPKAAPPKPAASDPPDESAPTPEEDAAARELEIAITASVGFWTTVGLLACWRILGAESEK